MEKMCVVILKCAFMKIENGENVDWDATAAILNGLAS